VNATGTERFAGFFPAAIAANVARKFSQYSCAGEAAVFVRQCSVAAAMFAVAKTDRYR
jgi:hypothetical protein